MRPILAPIFAPILALPLLAGCNVDNDSANDQVRIEYNQQRVEGAARATARTAREVGAGVGNVAVSTGRAVKKEVGDIDVDVTRNRSDRSGGNEAANR
ncbi:MAG: hypothetical protein QOJ91_1708 [Sphingomonadales bacterium]|jgi:hypothetical protein|nr:hypothetical protein [Sphingomonadales bacterium]